MNMYFRLKIYKKKKQNIPHVIILIDANEYFLDVVFLTKTILLLDKERN